MKIGIIGGGQLALMMIESQPQHEFFVLEPKLNPSVEGFAHLINKPYDDEESLNKLAKECDVVTYEFENIPANAIEKIGTKLCPNAKVLEVSQDRIKEKEFARWCGLKTVAFFKIDSLIDLETCVNNERNKSWILKINVGGYDGKGQVEIENGIISEEAKKLVKLGSCILEEKINFKYETSLIMSRSADGDFVYLPPTKNFHKDGILWYTHNFEKVFFVNEMVDYTLELMESLDMVGTLTVEFFVTTYGPVFNEMAPRPHNSGHWSIEGTSASQFFNHINAITNVKLVDPRLKGYTAMVNLLGDDFVIALKKIEFDKNVILHDYFKGESRPKRKLGHITINYSVLSQVMRKLEEVLRILGR